MTEHVTTKLLIATRNQGKVREIATFFAELGWHVEPIPADAPEVIEDGETFAANAVKKAEEIAAFYNCSALADDSGLEVDALGGRPGVHSARYAGEHGDDAANNAKLLQEMADVPASERRARFVSAIALARPGQETLVSFGTVEGHIINELRGNGGFGYDPLFELASGHTLAEISLEEKNHISHRAEALRSMVNMLKMESVK